MNFILYSCVTYWSRHISISIHALIRTTKQFYQLFYCLKGTNPDCRQGVARALYRAYIRVMPDGFLLYTPLPTTTPPSRRNAKKIRAKRINTCAVRTN